jgi:hypothetical protein
MPQYFVHVYANWSDEPLDSTRFDAPDDSAAFTTAWNLLADIPAQTAGEWHGKLYAVPVPYEHRVLARGDYLGEVKVA